MAPGRCSTQARQRLASTTPGRDDRARRAGVEAAPARAAAVGDRRVGGRVRRRRDHAAEHEPAAGARQQQVGVLAEPAEPGPVGDLAVDDGVVVGEGDGPLVGGPQPAGHRPQPARAAARSGRPRRSGPTRAGTPSAGRAGSSSARYDRAPTRTERAPGHGPRRIGRAVGVAVREAHAGGQPGVAPLVERRPGPLEHRRRRHAEVLDAERRGRARAARRGSGAGRGDAPRQRRRRGAVGTAAPVRRPRRRTGSPANSARSSTERAGQDLSPVRR